jgi:pimeloyl-ACP methyl ester carboxylesterase
MKKMLAVVLFAFFPLYAGDLSGKENISIEEFSPVKINGVKLMMLIRGNDISKPVLLHLHGGPGHSRIPFAHAATDKLVNDCIVVYYDQRGTGLSCNDSVPKKTMTVNQMIEDTKAVTDYLKKRFNKKKIFILGHSWGSRLGVLTVQKYPDDYYAFIGVGQVVSPSEQEKAGISWLKQKIAESGNEKEMKMIPEMEKKNFADRGLIMKYGGQVHSIKPGDLNAIMKSSPYSPGKYTTGLFKKGGVFSRPIYKEHYVIDHVSVPQRFKIPVYLFLGHYDYVTPTQPVMTFFDKMNAPLKEIIWFEKSGHQMDIEEPEKFQAAISRIISQTNE